MREDLVINKKIAQTERLGQQIFSPLTPTLSPRERGERGK